MAGRTIRVVKVVPRIKIEKELPDVDEDDYVLCQVCDKSFANETALRNHARMEHTDVFATGDASKWMKPIVPKTEPPNKEHKDVMIKKKTKEFISSMAPTNLMSLASEDVYIIIKGEMPKEKERKRKSEIERATVAKREKEKEKEVQPITKAPKIIKKTAIPSVFPWTKFSRKKTSSSSKDSLTLDPTRVRTTYSRNARLLKKVSEISNDQPDEENSQSDNFVDNIKGEYNSIKVKSDVQRFDRVIDNDYTQETIDKITVPNSEKLNIQIVNMAYDGETKEKESEVQGLCPQIDNDYNDDYTHETIYKVPVINSEKLNIQIVTIEHESSNAIDSEVNEDSNEVFEKTLITNKSDERVDTKEIEIDQKESHSEINNEIKHEPFFSCNQCNYRTLTSIAYEKHLRFHDLSRTYQCHDCGFRFKTKHVLKMHLSNHHSNKNEIHLCNTCGFTTSSAGNLKSHQRIHGEKPHKCDICNIYFTRKFHLRTHLRRHSSEKTFTCKLCPYMSSNENGLILHLFNCSRAQKDGLGTLCDKPFQCALCDVKLSNPTTFKRHAKIHIGDKPFCCDVCGRIYSNNWQLKTHLRTHTGERPFSCSLCSYKSAYKSHLKSHLATHSTEKPNSCPFCEYRCATKTCLHHHLKIHKEQKDFSCSYCDYKCSRKQHLKQHLVVHTGEKNYSCSKCFLTFARKKSLSLHQKRQC